MLLHSATTRGFASFVTDVDLVDWYIDRVPCETFEAPWGLSRPRACPISPFTSLHLSLCTLRLLLLLMRGFKFAFHFSGDDDAGDTQNEANECAAIAAAPAVEVAIPATLAAPIGPLQDVALGSDILIRLRVREHCCGVGFV